MHSLGALAWAEEDLDETEARFRQARELLAPVLTYLAESPTLDGAEHPYQAFLICGQMLLAVGQDIHAREIVGAAHDRLVAW